MSDGRITLWNPAAERITGYRASEVLGRRCCDVFVARDARGERFCPALCRSLLLNKRGEPVESFDLQVSSKGGRQIWLNMSTVVLPVTDAHGPRFIRMFRDVTAVKDVLALVRNRLAGTPADDDRLGRLTRREAEILRLMVSGATNRALADRLHVSPATIRNHTHHIFAKLSSTQPTGRRRARSRPVPGLAPCRGTLPSPETPVPVSIRNSCSIVLDVSTPLACSPT